MMDCGLPLRRVNKWCSYQFLTCLFFSFGYFVRSGFIFRSPFISACSSGRPMTSLKRLADWQWLRLFKIIVSSLNSRVRCRGPYDVSRILREGTRVSIIESNMQKSVRSLLINSCALSITSTMSPSMIRIFAKIESRVFIGSCWI